MSFFEKLIMDPCDWISFLVVVVIFEWLLFIKIFSLSKRSWKLIELTSLLIVNIGVLVYLHDNRVSFYKNKMNEANHKIEFVGLYINSMISTYEYDRSFNTGIYSRECLDASEEDYRRAGAWIKANKDSLLNSIKARAYYDTLFQNPPKFIVEKRIDEFERHIGIFKENIPKYKSALKDYNYYKERISNTNEKSIVEIITPILILISLSLQIVAILRTKSKKS